MPTTPGKRKRSNADVGRVGCSKRRTMTRGEAETLFLGFARNFRGLFNINPKDLLAELDEDSPSLGVSFSKVTYKQVAPTVGLQEHANMKDAPTFEFNRSRIHTNLFQHIVSDIDMMLVQYGPPHDHATEEARSRFFSPIFNHLVKQFCFNLRNEPEVTISGRICTQGRVEYFVKAFGSVAILFMEMELRVANTQERMKAIAQVIAEADACDAVNNANGLALPIHCILSDGLRYEVFRFDGRSPGQPHFLRGCLPNDPVEHQRGISVREFSESDNRLPFILDLRVACEVVFDIMLSAYTEALKAYLRRSQLKSKLTKTTRLSLKGWHDAQKAVESAQEEFRRGEGLRLRGELDNADMAVKAGVTKLQRSMAAVPSLFGGRVRPIMEDWDIDAVQRA